MSTQSNDNTYLVHDPVSLRSLAFRVLTEKEDGRRILFNDSGLLATLGGIVRQIKDIFDTTDTIVEACDIFLTEVSRFERSNFAASLLDRLVLHPESLGIVSETDQGTVTSKTTKLSDAYNVIFNSWPVGNAPITRGDIEGFNLATRQFLKINFNAIDSFASGFLQAGATFNRSASNIDASKFTKGVPSYTAVDMTIVATMGSMISVLDDVKVLTYSTHRNVAQVYAGGQVTRRGIARGHRTIAGTMICAIRLDDPLMKIHPSWMFGEIPNVVNTDRAFWRETLLNDQLPMFDILIIFQDERGHQSLLTIFGIQISDIGQVMSINDSIIEITFQYTAADVDILRYSPTETKDGVQTIKPYESDSYKERRRRVIYGTTISSNPFADPTLYEKNYATHSLKGLL